VTESRRELGLGLQSNKGPGEFGALARIAEDAGFDVVTVFNDLWFQPALPALLEIARMTTRARIGPSCLNPFTVHPVEIAGQIAALDLASEGRAFLGLARGSWLEPLGIDQSRPAEAIRDAWEVIRRLLEGDDSGYDGGRFSLPPAERLRYPVLRGDVPLLVGTWSPRLTELAGEAAQELKVGGSANPDLVPVVRQWIGNPAVRIVLGAVTVVDEDGQRARKIARSEVAMFLAVLAELDPTFSIDPELVSRIRDLVASRDDEGAGALIPDEVLDRFAFAGTPAQVAAHAEAVFDAGVGRVDFGTPHGRPEAHGVELLCREVLPRLR
jgi:5,10-methylenetetrahydromethanopterin reductase